MPPHLASHAPRTYLPTAHLPNTWFLVVPNSLQASPYTTHTRTHTLPLAVYCHTSLYTHTVILLPSCRLHCRLHGFNSSGGLPHASTITHSHAHLRPSAAAPARCAPHACPYSLFLCTTTCHNLTCARHHVPAACSCWHLSSALTVTLRSAVYLIITTYPPAPDAYTPAAL